MRRIIASLGATLFPAVGNADVSGGEVLPDSFDVLLDTLDDATRRSFLALLAVFEAGAVLRYGRPFSALTPERRTRYVDGWMRSRLPPFRIVYRALRLTCGFLYYQDARTWPAMGYAGPQKERST